MCLAQGHNAVTPVSLEPATLSLESSTLPLSHCAPFLSPACEELSETSSWETTASSEYDVAPPDILNLNITHFFAHPINWEKCLFYNFPWPIHVFKDNCAKFQDKWSIFQIPGIIQDQSQFKDFSRSVWTLFNPYKPSVLFVGHRQKEQTQIRRCRKRRLIRVPLFAYRMFC